MAIDKFPKIGRLKVFKKPPSLSHPPRGPFFQIVSPLVDLIMKKEKQYSQICELGIEKELKIDQKKF
ncbi:MAG: hypothetical protein CM15mP44_5770 [Candidatus Neomarinimicrobiota bacterium]|nr:MAG: hypothetical protein CM15mP44_5770 [Candidatus Neomarinimicrobiota bacterium]